MTQPESTQNLKQIIDGLLAKPFVDVVFSDGTRGTFDVGRYLSYPAFAPLRDGAFFRRVHAAHGTVAWSDEVDLCPDTVWLESVKTDVPESAARP